MCVSTFFIGKMQKYLRVFIFSHIILSTNKRIGGKYDIVNIGLHFFHKDVRLMLPLVVKHSIVAA